MEARIYKPKRLQNGKRVTARLYRARIKLACDSKVRDIALQVSDKQVDRNGTTKRRRQTIPQYHGTAL